MDDSLKNKNKKKQTKNEEKTATHLEEKKMPLISELNERK